jgi:hypothetical protein
MFPSSTVVPAVACEPRTTAGNEREVNEMTDFVRELEVRYPTHEEMEAYLRAGRRARARAVHDFFVGIRAMLQRAVSTKKAIHKPREA